jgi:drug/metabolite transporter (DMT)-like permease
MFDRTTLINWLLLMSLVLLWGTSFMFISISVESLHPLTTVFYRVLIGALILTFVVYAKGLRLPFTIHAWLAFMVMGIVGYVLPFFLISWGQLSVNSGIAGMIMATMPLITMILAHYLVDGENLNRYKVLGFTFGIGGIGVLLGPIFEGGGQAVYGGIAIFIAASSYAVNTILVRRLPKLNPFISTSGVLIAATIMVFPIWLFVVPANSEAVSTLVLSSIATLMLFAVINRAGPTFLSTINYLIPVVAFFTGAYVLSEPVESSSIAALVIILSGIALTRFRINQ